MKEPYEPCGNVNPMRSIGNGQPMYSFDTPSWAFWRGFAAGLRDRGLTDKEITAELCSTGTRHFLDNADQDIENLGREMGRSRYSTCLVNKPKL